MSTTGTTTGRRSGRLLVGLSGGWLFAQLGRQVLSPLLPTVIDRFAITPAAAGFVLTLMGVLYAAVHFPGGRFADQLSRKSVLAVGLVLSTVGFLALGLAGTYPEFLLGAATVGVGSGLFFIAMRIVVFEASPTSQGWLIGVNMAAGNAGAIAAAGLAAFVLTGGTWQSVFLAVAVGLVVALSLVHVWLDEPYTLDRVDVGLRETTARVFGTGRIRRLALAYSLVIFVWQGVLGFLPTFLQEAKSFPSALASGAFALVFFVGLLFMPLSGRVSDRFPRLTVVLGAIACCGVGLVWLVVVAGEVPTVAGVAVFGIGLMSFPSAMQAYVLDALPDGYVGGDFGAFKTVYTGVGALGPVYVGSVADVAGYPLALLTLVGPLLVAAVVLGVFSRA